MSVQKFQPLNVIYIRGSLCINIGDVNQFIGHCLIPNIIRSTVYFYLSCLYISLSCLRWRFIDYFTFYCPKISYWKNWTWFQIHLSRFKPRGRLSLNAEAESENEVEPVESIVQTTVDPRDNDVTEPTPRTSFVPQENKINGRHNLETWW